MPPRPAPNQADIEAQMAQARARAEAVRAANAARIPGRAGPGAGAMPEPAAPAVFSYTIPAPAGFTKAETGDPNTYSWTKQRPGRAVKSEYTVTLKKAGPFPERYLPNAATMEAGNLVFRQTRTTAAQFSRTVIFTCQDNGCLITLSATADLSDADAMTAMTNAAKKIAAK